MTVLIQLAKIGTNEKKKSRLYQVGQDKLASEKYKSIVSNIQEKQRNLSSMPIVDLQVYYVYYYCLTVEQRVRTLS